MLNSICDYITLTCKNQNKLKHGLLRNLPTPQHLRCFGVGGVRSTSKPLHTSCGNFEVNSLYSKIIILGSAGAGKSWLAKRLAVLTGYPLYHLDIEFWKPNWEMTPQDEFITRQQEITSGEQWIIEGDYKSTMEIRFAAANFVIFLDIGRFTKIISLAKRMGKKRSDLPDYLHENGLFSKDFLELAAYIWQYNKTRKPLILALRDKYPDKEFLHIKSRRKLKNILKIWDANIK